jgi:hypothetical protein
MGTSRARRAVPSAVWGADDQGSRHETGGFSCGAGRRTRRSPSRGRGRPAPKAKITVVRVRLACPCASSWRLAPGLGPSPRGPSPPTGALTSHPAHGRSPLVATTAHPRRNSMRSISRPTDTTHGSRRVLLLLFTSALAVAVLATVLGPGAALGQDETASPAADGGKIELKIGWTGEIDNLNPFIGWTNNVYQIFGCQYLLMVGRNWDTNQPDGAAASPRAGRSRTTARLDLLHERGHDVARRRADHRRGRRLHLQLHHRERDRRLHHVPRRRRPR